MTCGSCNKSCIAWSQEIISALDPVTRTLFPAWITEKYESLFYSKNSNHHDFINSFHLSCNYCRWASLLCITPPKRYYHWPFFNLPGLHKPGRNHFPKNSYWGITDLCILISQNNLWTNSLIMIQGNCSYIFFFKFA